MWKLLRRLIGTTLLCILASCGETVHTYYYTSGTAILGKIEDKLQCYKLTLGSLDENNPVLPEITIVFPNGETYDIRTIPHATLVKYGVELSKLPNYSLKVPDDAKVYQVGEAWFVIRDGSTIYLDIWRRWNFTVREGKAVDRPATLRFASEELAVSAVFPMEKEKLIKLLGPPNNKVTKTHMPNP